jgi:hypothetical protein
MFIAHHDLLGDVDHLLRTHSRIQTQVPQRAIEALDVFLKPEGAAVKGAGHVEGAVTVPPTPVAVPLVTKNRKHFEMINGLAIDIPEY